MGYWPSFPKSAAKLQRYTAKTCQYLKKMQFFCSLLQFIAKKALPLHINS